jgi:hypothetical protein
MRIPALFCIATLSAFVAAPAFAQGPADVSHAYSSIEGVRKTNGVRCRTIELSGIKDHPLLTQRCPEGPGGWPVTMYSFDARIHVWFGKQAEAGTSVAEALEGAFADPHSVIEWRIADGRPFAAIHRYYLDNRTTLLVHRLQPNKTSCVAAVVNPRPGHNANAEAVEIADRIGPTFRCGRDRLVIDGKVQMVSERN